MEFEKENLNFLASPENGFVSAILLKPKKPTHLLVLGHGASTNMNHSILESIALSLAGAEIATFRYNFPYSENGTGRNSNSICVATIRAAVRFAHQTVPDLPILVGGHSFGGRMSSTAQAEKPIENVTGLVFFSFPLHMPDRPAIERAEHLKKIEVPMLFLSGTRDKLARPDLLTGVCEQLGNLAALHFIDTSDHGYKIQKRLRSNSEDVFEEMSRVVREWLG